MNAFLVFQQMLVLLTMMVIGYVVFKIDWLDDHSCKRLSKIVVNISNPLLVINGVIGKNSVADKDMIIENIVLVVVYFILLASLSFLVSFLLRLKKPEFSLYQLMLIFSNVGFMGIPVITSIYGSEATLFIAFYMLGYNLLLYTCGIALVERGSGEKAKASMKERLKKIFLNAGVISCIVSFIIFAFHLEVPASVATFVSYTGNTAVPFSMILIGASIAQNKIMELVTDVKIYIFTFIKLLVIPIIAAFAIRPFGFHEMIAGIFIFMLAMPVGSIVVLLATNQGVDAKCCTKGIVLSTLCSVATIPIVSLFL